MPTTAPPHRTCQGRNSDARTYSRPHDHKPTPKVHAIDPGHQPLRVLPVSPPRASVPWMVSPTHPQPVGPTECLMVLVGLSERCLRDKGQSVAAAARPSAGCTPLESVVLGGPSSCRRLGWVVEACCRVGVTSQAQGAFPDCTPAPHGSGEDSCS